MVDLSFIPVWAYFVGGAILCLIIYNYLDEPLKASLKNFAKSYGIWILILLVFLWGRYNWGGWTEEDLFYKKANTFLIVAGLVWFGMQQFLGKERYISTQAICDNRSGSCAKYQKVGDYIILNIGSCDSNMFPWDFGHESWVVPLRHFNKVNNDPNASAMQIEIKTNVQKCDLTEVPPLCADFIETTTGYNKENIYYGEFSLDELKSGFEFEIEGKKIDVKEYGIRLKDANRMINEARAMVKGKTKSILGYISHVGTIMKKAKGTEKRPEYKPEQEY